MCRVNEISWRLFELNLVQSDEANSLVSKAGPNLFFDRQGVKFGGEVSLPSQDCKCCKTCEFQRAQLQKSKAGWSFSSKWKNIYLFPRDVFPTQMQSRNSLNTILFILLELPVT